MRRLLCAFLAFAFCTTALSAECPIGTTPAQYVQLEYIESTGTQYIDTGFVNNDIVNIKYVIDFAFNELDNGNCGLWGAFNGTRSGCVWLSSSSQKFSISAGDTDSDHSSVKINADTDRHVGIVDIHYISGTSRYNFEFDGTNYSGVFGSKNYYTSDTVMLFRGSLSSFHSVYAKIYSFKIYSENVLVRDFIPALRLIDGKPGMYDTVSGKFFTNAGTGEFIMGPLTGDIIGFDTDNCAPCPPNTYKDFVGNGECTSCPDALISPSGSTSINDCGRALWIDGKVLFMPSVPRTKHTLNIMDSDGNIFYGNLYSEQ